MFARIFAQVFSVSLHTDGSAYDMKNTLTLPRGFQRVTAVELVIAPAAIERALHLYEQLQPHDTSVILQARKILTQHIFGMVDQGELDEQKLIAGGLAHLKAVEREHGIKSAHAGSKKPKNAASFPRLMECDQRIIHDGASSAFDSRRFEI